MKDRMGAIWVVIAVATVGCSGGLRLGGGDGRSEGTCRASSKSESPFVAAWSPVQRAALDSEYDSRVAVVRFDGCELQVLEECRLKGRYVFGKTSRISEEAVVDPGDARDGPLSLVAQGAGRKSHGDLLSLQYVGVGTRMAKISASSKGMLTGACEGATHFVRTILVGAYELREKDNDGAGKIVSTGGDLALCRRSVSADKEASCRAALQVTLTPLSQMGSEEDDLYETVRMTMGFDESLGGLARSAGFAESTNEERDGFLDSMSTPPAVDDEDLCPVAREIAGLPDGGSEEWDAKIKPRLVSAYDANDSERIDTVEEVTAIPCDVFLTLDRAVRLGRGGIASLRGTYGFMSSLKWVGGVLGFDEGIRDSADARLANCGL